MDILISKLDSIQADLTEVKNQQKEFHTSLEFFENKIDNFTKKMNISETKIKVVSAMQIENFQQCSRINNIKNNGLPEKSFQKYS